MTLEQLKAMSDEGLLISWSRAEFPFDEAKCGLCLVGHCDLPLCRGEGCEHTEFQKSVPDIYPASGGLRRYLEEIFALRLRFRDLYQLPVPEDAEPSVIEANRELTRT
jgi:hypothetical protein